MRLEMAEFPVRRIRLGDVYRYQDGSLDVDREDLTRLVLRAARKVWRRWPSISRRDRSGDAGGIWSDASAFRYDRAGHGSL